MDEEEIYITFDLVGSFKVSLEEKEEAIRALNKLLASFMKKHELDLINVESKISVVSESDILRAMSGNHDDFGSDEETDDSYDIN